MTGVVASQRPGQGCHTGRDGRSGESPRQQIHPDAAPYQVGKVLPGHKRGHPVGRHEKVEPIGRIKNAVERIGENGKANSLQRIPARHFPAQQRIAHEPARRQSPVGHITVEDNATQPEREIDHTQDGHSQQ